MVLTVQIRWRRTLHRIGAVTCTLVLVRFAPGAFLIRLREIIATRITIVRPALGFALQSVFAPILTDRLRGRTPGYQRPPRSGSEADPDSQQCHQQHVKKAAIPNQPYLLAQCANATLTLDTLASSFRTHIAPSASLPDQAILSTVSTSGPKITGNAFPRLETVAASI